VKDRIVGFIFTFDWFPPIREISNLCEELGIKRILVLHESVFLDEEKYYLDPTTGESTPIADYILCWGELQKNIFISRGIDPKKFYITGAPKFDVYNNYTPTCSRQVFYKFYSLDSSKKTILYVMQLMDIQVDQEFAVKRQEAAVKDVIEFCLNNDVQLIIRGLPIIPNISLFSDDVLEIINSYELLVYDKLPELSPEDSIFHTDLTLSVNSTMLFEALLLGKSVISTKYIEFEQIWSKMKLPSAENRAELFELLEKALESDKTNIPKEGWEWAKRNLSVGEFDGRSAERVRHFLENLVTSS
jgi:CDP-glycerol glycerophosphotransferase (TagB/SpsB family)